MKITTLPSSFGSKKKRTHRRVHSAEAHIERGEQKNTLSKIDRHEAVASLDTHRSVTPGCVVPHAKQTTRAYRIGLPAGGYSDSVHGDGFFFTLLCVSRTGVTRHGWVSVAKERSEME